MPWKESSPMHERMRFVTDYRTGLFGLSEVARRHGVSRKTAYKWLRRVELEGPAGLVDRPPVASQVANRTDLSMESLIVAYRRKHPTWGPRKLLWTMAEREERVALPSASTVAAILKRHGLSAGKRRRRREGHPGKPRSEAVRPNDIWGADFKGQFRTRDGRYCYPFTVTDLYSRYLIVCDGKLTTKGEGVRASLETAFREYGLPEAIRTDNGTPFASTGIARLTQLGVWLTRLGVRRELIQPARPDQNGCHERMHRTMKAEATRPAKANLSKQQRRFAEFMTEFNQERPHEALGMSRPAELYRPSDRPYPSVLPEPEYPGHFEVRRVSRNGGVRWRGAWLNVGHALLEESVGFEEVDDGVWDAYFCDLPIGRFDERDLRLVGTLGTHGRCGKRGDRRVD